MLNFRRLAAGTGIYWDKGRAYVLVVINRSAGGHRAEEEAVRCQETHVELAGVVCVCAPCSPATPRRLNTANVHKDTKA
ncbi:hypothetical protein E2C01_094270 [Portunus trituberculatus]|uniref:Uncharacterized protein n=1 Tax=Portunus trituberculatus TaxID=210409 RepID=A0A5B7K2N3_PORTR|nr:hypothetical protein [Portunus trituberculatus]